MTTQHTQGPWLLDTSENGLLVAYEGIGIAKALDNCDTWGEARANARLIAAAPETAAERDRLKSEIELRKNATAMLQEQRDELLEALALAQNVLRQPHLWAQEAERTADDCRAAIAKATAA